MSLSKPATPSSPKGNVTPPPPSRRLTDLDFELLPDLVILTIMDNMPLKTLIHSNEVCRRWSLLRPVAMNRREVLYLLGHEIDQRMMETPGWNFGLMKDVVTGEAGESLLITPKPYLDIYYLVLPDPGVEAIDRIMELFPNIKVLRISQRDVRVIECLKVRLLLQQYKNQLQELSYELWSNDQEDNYEHLDPEDQQYRDDLTKEHFLSMIRCINNLPVLRKLALNMQAPANSAIDIPLDLSIISQLTELDIRTCGFDHEDRSDGEVLFPSLIDYAAENPALREIIQHNFVELDRIMAIHPSIGPKYREIQIDTSITRHNYDLFTRFCGRFVNVLDLSARLQDVTLVSAVQALQPMSKLAHFSFNLNFDPNDTHVAPKCELPDEKLPSLPSVVALSIFIDTGTHLDIADLRLHLLFPNCQVVLLRHFSHCCSLCDYNITRRRAQDPEPALMAECMRLSRACFKKMTKLRRLLANTQPSPLVGEWTEAEFNWENVDQLPTDEMIVGE